MGAAAVTLIAKNLFLKELGSFKKEFKNGFRDLFGGPSIDTIIDHAKSTIVGLQTPINNEINAILNKFTQSDGINDLLDAANTKLTKDLAKITEDPRVKLLLLGTNHFINKLIDYINGLIDTQIQILSLWLLWLDTLPPPPPGPPVIIPTPHFPTPLPFQPPVIISPGDPIILLPGDGRWGWH